MKSIGVKLSEVGLYPVNGEVHQCEFAHCRVCALPVNGYIIYVSRVAFVGRGKIKKVSP